MKRDELRELQIRFKKLVTPIASTTEENIGPLSDESLFREPANSALLRERLEVYRFSYSTRIFESLRDDFPRVFNAVPGEMADQLLGEYLKSFPPRSWTLAEHGADFPKFLRNHSVIRDFPFLADLAELEWNRVLCFLDQVPQAFDFSMLSPWTAEQWVSARIILNPSIRSLQSRWPLLQSATSKGQWVTSKVPMRLAVFQNAHGQISEIELSERELEVIAEIESGTPLLQIGDVMERKNFTAAEVSSRIASWVQTGFIEKVTNEV